MLNIILATIVLSFTVLGAAPDTILMRMTPEEFLSTFHNTGSWTVDDINYAALLVDTEVGHMGPDAAYSVLSTVESRFHSPNWCQSYYCSKTLLEEMQRPNQFVGPEYAISIGMEFEDIDRESYLYVYKYILGERGSTSCLRFEYFNSAVGGPSQCKITASNGLWTEFWSTDSFIQTQEDGHYRNGRIGYSTIYRSDILLDKPTPIPI